MRTAGKVGKDPNVTVRFPTQMKSTVENLATRNKVDRSTMVRALVNAGLVAFAKQNDDQT